MCVLSMISDHYDDKFKDIFKKNNLQEFSRTLNISVITREEFEALKKEVQEMKELLKKAKDYDEKNNEPNCEKDDKIELIKKIAIAVGVDLEEIFGKKDK